MTFNHQLVNRFLEAIFPLPRQFGVLLSENENPEPINFLSFEKAIHGVDCKASISFGMSKIVILSPNLGNVVIKIPFNGYFDEYYSCAEDEEVTEWQPFSWAPGPDGSDYCLAEYEKYKRLKVYGLDCFVAKIYHYKTINGIRIFLQEKVIPENDMCIINRPSHNSQNIADRWRDEGKFYRVNSKWIANCLDKYGKSKVERFLNYCKNIDLDILEDAHGANFGYRENDTPCILDYSNYLG